MDNKRFYTTKDVAEYFSVNPLTVRHWLEIGIIRGSRIGHKYFIPKGEIERLINKIEGNKNVDEG